MMVGDDGNLWLPELANMPLLAGYKWITLPEFRMFSLDFALFPRHESLNRALCYYYLILLISWSCRDTVLWFCFASSVDHTLNIFHLMIHNMRLQTTPYVLFPRHLYSPSSSIYLPLFLIIKVWTTTYCMRCDASNI